MPQFFPNSEEEEKYYLEDSLITTLNICDFHLESMTFKKDYIPLAMNTIKYLGIHLTRNVKAHRKKTIKPH